MAADNGGGGTPCDVPWETIIDGSESIPCKSSFNFVKQGDWQSAVITDYRFTFYDRTNNKSYTINIGMIETGMPSVTYNGTIIHSSSAQAMAAQAATLAEAEVMHVVATQVIISPNSPIDNQYYKNMFKTIYLLHLNNFLRSDYYDGANVSPARVGYDNSAFSLKDQTKYKTLKFYGRDC